MLYRVIDASELPSLVSAFLETYEVIAPVKSGMSHAYSTVESFEEIALDYMTTITPLKKLFLPVRETLLTFDTETNDVTEYSSPSHRASCSAPMRDINALNSLDLVFRDGPYPDPYYTARRNATLIVGISCMPTDTCFCHLCGTDEARFGYDLFLQDIGGKYLVSISSVEAANILEAACSPREATDEERAEFRHVTRRRQEAFNKEIPDIQEVAMLMDAFHSDPFWGGTRRTLPVVHRVRLGVPDVLLLRYPRRAHPRRKARLARARVGLLHEPAVRRRGGRAQLPTRRAQPRAPSHVSQAQRLSCHARPHALRGMRALRARLQGQHQSHRGAEVLRAKGGRRCRITLQPPQSRCIPSMMPGLR